MGSVCVYDEWEESSEAVSHQEEENRGKCMHIVNVAVRSKAGSSE